MKPIPLRAGHCILKSAATCSENTSEVRFVKPQTSFKDILTKYQTLNLKKLEKCYHV